LDRQLYREHDELEATHWWFAARRRIVFSLLAGHLRGGSARVLDVGCGAGGTLAHLRELCDHACGLEPDPESAAIARLKAGVDVRHGSLPDDVPFQAASFHVITALDVIEHISDDVGALRKMFDLLEPGGTLLCTVPAYQFLWSEHDVRNHHYRRYTKSELTTKLGQVGFQVRRASYFNTLLFPLVASARLWRRVRAYKGCAIESDLRRHSRVVNTFFEELFASERLLLRALSLPFGVSLIVIAERPLADSMVLS
jgi:SAM-dependent methyltransferase